MKKLDELTKKITKVNSISDKANMYWKIRYIMNHTSNEASNEYEKAIELSQILLKR